MLAVSSSTTLAISIVAAVVTAFVGSFLTQRREHARWIRERRLEAYADLVAGAADVVSADDDAGRNEHWRSFNRASQATQLVGSMLMASKAFETYKAVAMYRDEPTKEHGTEVWGCTGRFTASARSDLEPERMTLRMRWIRRQQRKATSKRW